jgi:hypothetical protein
VTEAIAAALIWAFVGFQWGEWWTARKHRKRLDGDVGLKLLAEMAYDISERRKIVGRALTIRASHTLGTKDEEYTLSLEAKGDPNTLIDGGYLDPISKKC